MSHTPTKRTHPQTHKTQRIRTPKCTHSSQAKKHYVNPTPTLLPPLQNCPFAGISKRKALSSECHKNTERLQLGNHSPARRKSLYPNLENAPESSKVADKNNKVATTGEPPDESFCGGARLQPPTQASRALHSGRR